MRTPRLLRSLAAAGGACDVAAGNNHSLVATRDGGCFGFGVNQWWQLALGESRNYMEPTQARPCACVLAAQGRVGLRRRTHECFLCPVDVITVPVQIPGGQELARVSAGGTFSAGVNDGGRLLMWGTDANNRGVFASAKAMQLRRPTLIESAAFKQVHAGFESMAAITQHGRLVSWGWSGTDLVVRPLCQFPRAHVAAIHCAKLDALRHVKRNKAS